MQGLSNEPLIKLQMIKDESKMKNIENILKIQNERLQKYSLKRLTMYMDSKLILIIVLF